MDEDTTRRVYADPLARWFVTEAYKIADTAELVAASGGQLVAAGIPLYRLAYFQRTLHPELMGKGYFWRRGQGVEVFEAAHSLLQDAEYLDNPLPAVYDKGRTIRVRLAEADPKAPILRQLKDEGATDYIALPLLFSTGRIDALSIVSDSPDGFSTHDLDRMFLLQFAFTRIVEVHTLRDIASNLLDAYVGRAAGQRILAGEIRRGDGQSIDAVIWYCDLRGFTRASDSLPRDAVIALLNDYFDTMGKAIVAAGGEVLKFMGDGLLAMFPIAGQHDRAAVATQAARAASTVAEEIAALNRRRAADGKPVLRFGLALHVGEVMFGNIGASSRLDFTVIGPTVNHAARLEKLCAPLDRQVVFSAAFAALLPAGQAVFLGQHTLKDIDEPQAVFAPPA